MSSQAIQQPAGGRGRGRGGQAGRVGRGGMGRGGGGGGRGAGRGAAVPKPIPNYLNYLNSYNTQRMLSYLPRVDGPNLAAAYYKFKVMFQQQEQQRQRQILLQKQRREHHLRNFIYDKECTAEKLAEEAKKAKEEAEQKAKEEEEAKKAKEEEEKKEEDPELAKLKAKQKKDSIATVNESMSDSNTMLARLNTKRLYRRIKYLRKEDKEMPIKDIYQLGLNSQELAFTEWQRLLDGFKLELFRQRQIKKLTEEGKEIEEKYKNRAGPRIIPSSCELLLFSPCPRAVAVLASYPRSGNSLLRNLYEKLTLRVSGSDMRGGLTKHDMVGEAATQTKSVQFVKTHFPERRGSPQFPVDRAVLLVRNPYDAMESYFNLMTTNTHTTSLTDEQRAKSAAAFAAMAKKEIQVWRDFHEYWLKQKIPLLVIRYEDLIRYTDIVMAKVIRFTLEIKDMSFFEERLDRCIREEQIESLGSYKPRSGGIGKSLSKYPVELLQEVNTQGVIGTMTKFGYREMLIPNPQQWKLEPMDQHGVYIAGSAKEPLVINTEKGLCRTPARNTDWNAVKRSMMSEKPAPPPKICKCEKCVKARWGIQTTEDDGPAYKLKDGE